MARDVSSDHGVDARPTSEQADDLEMLDAAGRWARGGKMLDIQLDEGPEGHQICRPAGEIDAATVSQFRAVLGELSENLRVVIDLSDVTFVDSAGLGALIGGIRRTRELGGDVVLACPRPSMARLLRTTGLDHIVTIANSLEEAHQALLPAPPATG
jgi:anti-sigma B factor antagonist